MKSVKELPPFDKWGLSEDVLAFLDRAQVTPEEMLWYVRITMTDDYIYDIMFNFLTDSYFGEWSPNKNLFEEECFDEMCKKLCEEIAGLGMFDEYLWPSEFCLFLEWLYCGFEGLNFSLSCYGYFLRGRKVVIKHDLYESICTDVQTVVTELLTTFRPMLPRRQYEMLEFAFNRWDKYSLRDDYERIFCKFKVEEREEHGYTDHYCYPSHYSVHIPDKHEINCLHRANYVLSNEEYDLLRAARINIVRESKEEQIYSIVFRTK